MVRHFVIHLLITIPLQVHSTSQINLDGDYKWSKTEYDSTNYTEYERYTQGGPLADSNNPISNHHDIKEDCELFAFAQAECTHAGYVCKHEVSNDKCYATLYAEDRVSEFNEFPRSNVSDSYVFDGSGTEAHTELTLRKSVLGYRGSYDIAWGTGYTYAAWINMDTVQPSDEYVRVFDFAGGPGENNVLLTFNGIKTNTNINYFDHLEYSVRTGYNANTGSHHFDSFQQYDSPIRSNQWHHIVLSHKRKDTVYETQPNTAPSYNNWAPELQGGLVTDFFELYIDGVIHEKGSYYHRAMRFPNNVPRPGLYIGKSHWTTNTPFRGRMRDVFLWNTALTQSEVSDLYSKNKLSHTDHLLVDHLRSFPSYPYDSNFTEIYEGQPITYVLISNATCDDPSDQPRTTMTQEECQRFQQNFAPRWGFQSGSDSDIVYGCSWRYANAIQINYNSNPSSTNDVSNEWNAVCRVGYPWPSPPSPPPPSPSPPPPSPSPPPPSPPPSPPPPSPPPPSPSPSPSPPPPSPPPPSPSPPPSLPSPSPSSPSPLSPPFPFPSSCTPQSHSFYPTSCCPRSSHRSSLCRRW